MNKELKRYIPIADMLAETFGKDCEIVIHDLSMPQASVVYAVNNHVTEHVIGQSFDHLIKNVLLARDFSNDFKANYISEVMDNSRVVKSSTAFIRDNRNKIIGAFCINFDISRLKHVEEFIKEFMHIESKSVDKDIEHFDHVVGIVDDLIEQILGDVDIERLKRREKIELIHFMDKKGIFLIKGMIEKVAEKLNISKVTVYSYLDEIKKNNQLLEAAMERPADGDAEDID